MKRNRISIQEIADLFSPRETFTEAASTGDTADSTAGTRKARMRQPRKRNVFKNESTNEARKESTK